MKISLPSKILPSPKALILFLVFVGCAVLPLVLAALAYLLHSVAAKPGPNKASQQSPPSLGSQQGKPGNGATGIAPASNHSRGHPKLIPVGPDTSAITAAEAAERPSVPSHPDGK
ncbi:MAG: hypothetical protein ACREBY_00145 [Polaromonas sp.]